MPGVSMIHQQTDDLSQGVWASAQHLGMLPWEEMVHIFWSSSSNCEVLASSDGIVFTAAAAVAVDVDDGSANIEQTCPRSPIILVFCKLIKPNLIYKKKKENMGQANKNKNTLKKVSL